jgi:hypothetical protein
MSSKQFHSKSMTKQPRRWLMCYSLNCLKSTETHNFVDIRYTILNGDQNDILRHAMINALRPCYRARRYWRVKLNSWMEEHEMNMFIWYSNLFQKNRRHYTHKHFMINWLLKIRTRKPGGTQLEQQTTNVLVYHILETVSTQKGILFQILSLDLK